MASFASLASRRSCARCRKNSAVLQPMRPAKATGAIAQKRVCASETAPNTLTTEAQARLESTGARRNHRDSGASRVMAFLVIMRRR